MRKALLFLVLFGLGLAVLVWVDRSRSAQDQPAMERPTLEQAPGAEGGTEGGTEGGSGQEGSQEGSAATGAGSSASGTGTQDPEVLADVKISGKADFSVFDKETNKKAYRIEADNFVPSGGPRERTYRVLGVTLEVFDTETGDLRSTLNAAEGRFGVTPALQLEDLRISDDGRVELIDVNLVQHMGGPLAPIEVDAPRMEIVLEREVFRSLGDGEVRVRGNGLDASGLGLELDGRAGKMSLERGGRVELLMQDESRAIFTAPAEGRIEVVSVGTAGEGRLEATATGRARLDFEGDPTGNVEADVIRGYMLAPDERGVSLERVSAEGKVAVTWAGSRFFGEDAQVRLGDSGLVEHINVLEDPSARFMIVGADGSEEQLELDGAGPLEVDIDAERPDIAHFRFTGPATFRAPQRNVTLDARGVLTGFADTARGEATVGAREDVEFRQGETRATAQMLDALFTSTEGDAIDVTCTGETQFIGRPQTRGLFEMGAREEVRFEVRGDKWFVPYAREATVSGTGTDPVHVTAGVLRDFDEEAGTFIAEEGVAYTAGPVAGSAERAVASPEGVLSFFGVAGAPALARLVDGDEGERITASFEALEIDVRAERGALPRGFEARGSVNAAVNTGDIDFELAAGTLELTTERELGQGGPFLMEAAQVRQLEFAEDGTRSLVSCDELFVRGTLPDPDTGKLDPAAVPTEVLAQGAVRIQHEGEYAMNAEGERLEHQVGGRSRLEGLPGQKVQAQGKIAGRQLGYELEATWIEYEKLRLEAAAPDLTILGSLLPGLESQDPPEGAEAEGDEPRTTIEAEHVRVDARGAHFDGAVRVRGSTAEGLPIVLEADSFRVGGVLTEEGLGNLQDAIQSFEARGRVLVLWGGLGYARGDRIRATRERVVIVGDPAIIDVAGHTLESDFIDVDLVRYLLACQRGVLRAPEESGGWSIEFAAVRPVLSPQGTLLALSNPIFLRNKDEARAQFAAVWIDEEAWTARGDELLWGVSVEDPEAPGQPLRKEDEQAGDEAEPSEEGDLVSGLFARLARGETSKLIRALWLEADVESTKDGKRVARADEVYLDLVTRLGRLGNAELVHELQLGSRSQPVRTKATEILAGTDGSLSAERATLTACDHDEPHYVIEVGKLLMIPREDGRWRFGAQENRIAFRGGLQLPLPSLGNAVLDEEGDFIGFEDEEGEVQMVDELAVSKTARFGTTLGASFNSEIGNFGRGAARWIGFDRDRVQGSWQYDAAWLSSRGPLLGVGLSLTERSRKSVGDTFWLDLYATGIPDGGDDSGLLPVPEHKRDDFRRWFYGRGRYPFSEKTWIDLAFSTQSDPGVQAEFYQSDYERFEQRDNYLHVRSARDGSYVDASIETRANAYRTEVEELPSAGYYRGASKLASLGSYSLDYSFSLDADNLRRQPGDTSKHEDGLRYEEPFRDSFGDTDKLGTREVLRVDNQHLLEVPIATGVAGLMVTPRLEGRATVWDQGVEAGDDPSRLALLGGVDMATTVHKRVTDGFLHSLTPSVGFSTDLAIDEGGGQPVRFDSVDDPLDGQQIEVGLRSLWRKVGSNKSLDLELRGARRTNRAEGLEDLEQVTVLGELQTTVLDRPLTLRHDGRYDTTNGETPYSRSSMGLVVSPRLEFEVGFRRGIPEARKNIFEAATIDTLFRLDHKWEIELGQQISLSGNDVLKSQGVLRRFSHDFVMELALSHRVGEGTSFGISFRPLLAYGGSKIRGYSEND